MSGGRLELVRLRKSFGALHVTDDLSLEVEPQELHAIIGPNGAGKTSLVHQISGFLASDSGVVRMDGEDLSGLPMAARARRGLVRSFQITALLEGFSVLDNVALAVQAREGSSFRFFGRADREEKLNRQAMESLRTVGLAERADVVAGRLSHGEKRLLEMAVALATRPRIMLLDEPLAGTGREESTALIGLLQSLKGRCTIVLIEHDMDAVFALADRISVLVSGRIIATGTPDAVRGDPQVRAAYLGEEAA